MDKIELIEEYDINIAEYLWEKFAWDIAHGVSKEQWFDDLPLKYRKYYPDYDFKKPKQSGIV